MLGILALNVQALFACTCTQYCITRERQGVETVSAMHLIL